MNDKRNKLIGIGIAVIVGFGILYGVFTWAKNGNPIGNVITGAVLMAAVVVAVLRASKEQAPFNNFKNDWQAVGSWILIGILAVVSLLFLSGFGKFFSL